MYSRRLLKHQQYHTKMIYDKRFLYSMRIVNTVSRHHIINTIRKYTSIQQGHTFSARPPKCQCRVNFIFDLNQSVKHHWTTWVQVHLIFLHTRLITRLIRVLQKQHKWLYKCYNHVQGKLKGKRYHHKMAFKTAIEFFISPLIVFMVMQVYPPLPICRSRTSSVFPLLVVQQQH